MRKSLFAPIVLIAALFVPAGIGLATASFKQVATIAVTGRHAGAARTGASVGLSVKLVSTDVAAPGRKPKATKTIAAAFPPGTHFNLRNSVTRACRLSDAQIAKPFGPMCGAASQVGTGTALLDTYPMGLLLTEVKPPLVATVRAKVHVYVHTGGRLIIVLYLNSYDLPGAAPVILHGQASGHTLTLAVPRIVYGKSKTLKFPGVPATIVWLKVGIAPRGTGPRALIRAGTCDAGRFVVTSHFTYFDHTRLTVRSVSRCSP